jgi:hypothetical protein
MIRPLWPVLCWALIAPVLCAQNPPRFQGEEYRRAWPLVDDLQLFGRSLAAELTGDGRIDALVAKGDELFLIYGLRLYGVIVPLQSPTSEPVRVVDFDLVRVAADDSLQVLVLTETSLECWRYLPEGTWTQQTIESLEWSGAKRVRAADWDGDGLQDVVGVAADERSILRLRQESDGSFLAGPTLTGSVALGEVEVIDPALDGLPLLAAAVADGIELIPLDGGPRSRHSVGAAAGALTGLKNGELAWLDAPEPETEQVLHVLQSDGTLEPPMTLGMDLQALAVASGDMDGDLLPDVWVSHSYSHEDPLFFHRGVGEGSTARFSIYDPDVLLLPLIENSWEENRDCRAEPLVVDADGDGDLDLAIGVESSDEHLLVINPVVDASRLTPVFGEIQFSGISAQGYQLDFELYPSLVDVANEVEITAYCFNPDNGAIGTAAVFEQRYPMPEEGIASLSVVLPESRLSFQDHYYLIASLLQTAEEHILQRFPTWISILSSDTEYILSLERNGIATGSPILLYPLTEGTPESIGGLVSLPTLPPFGGVPMGPAATTNP